MSDWRIIRMIEANGAMQMAIDEAIAIACSEGKSPPTLRFYSFKPHAITMGNAQRISSFNVDEIRKKGLEFVRRITGGTSVLHKNDLVYSLVLPESFLPNGVTDSYNYLSDGIVKGLVKVGIKASKKYAESKKREDSCYLNDNPYDIVVNGRKISGNAQARLKGVVLQHGTIIIENNFGELIDCLKLSKGEQERLLKEAGQKVTFAEGEMGRKINLSELENAMISGFAELFSEKKICLKEGQLSLYEKELAERLFREKYSTKEWNFER